MVKQADGKTEEEGVALQTGQLSGTLHSPSVPGVGAASPRTGRAEGGAVWKWTQLGTAAGASRGAARVRGSDPSLSKSVADKRPLSPSLRQAPSNSQKPDSNLTHVSERHRCFK